MMLTGSLDQLTHLSASSPLVLVHIGDLLQLELGVEDLVPLLVAAALPQCVASLRANTLFGLWRG